MEIVIVGGGLSGLSALNQLADLGIRASLFESKTYPSHRICGEFYSPECVKFLKRWGVEFPVTINKAKFISGNNQADFDLPESAYGISRYSCEYTLAKRAISLGSRVVTNVNVNSMQYLPEEGHHKLTLSTGEVVFTPNVIVATGRHSLFAQKNWAPFPNGVMPFIGIKAHFEGIPKSDVVEVHSFPGAYLGISSIEDGKTNVACLAKTSSVQAAGGPEKFMNSIMPYDAKNVFPRYLTCGIPPFGVRNVPTLPGLYFVGDVMGAITPVCGDGMAMGITSGIMAANYAFNNDSRGYAKEWKSRYSNRLFFGQKLQQMLLNEKVSSLGVKMFSKMPFLSKLMFNLTRESAN